MEYKHRGVKIEFVEMGGVFVAIVNDKRTTAPSLSAIKSKIDKAQANTFEPFDAFRFSSDGYRSTKPDKIEKFRVTGIERKSRGLRAGFGFTVSGGGFYSAPNEVILDTPENLVLANEIIQHKVATALMLEARTAQLEALEGKLKVRRADQEQK